MNKKLQKTLDSLDKIERELITAESEVTDSEEAPTKIDQSVLTMPEE